mgnify:CR=1 FL=1|tara:strand:- start:121 stop:474 length:354 start_codon:yes stop_codon:yes gene_type:complete
MIEEYSEELDGKYMRITVGDETDEKEIILYGVMSMIHWDKLDGRRYFISFTPDQQHPSNGNPYNYPFAVIAPLDTLIAYEFVPAETEYAQYMLEMARTYKIGFLEKMKRRNKYGKER